ncbi:MAG: DUF4395 domain-containing protein [Candidatus Marinimicrobia bacterium]|nr:DUF4395 domain-containing protein [Candidatus Neomarinimicrobiota bacterium]
MSKIIGFGEKVDGYNIPVLNEREIRAAAGLLFLVMLFSIQAAGGAGNFTPIKYAVTFFLTDMLIRVFINPRYSPTLIVGRLIVRNQVPEYVGAQQKKFAWYIGIGMAIVMFVLIVLVNSYSPITGLICFICLIFLFFESAFGICLGCKVYPWIYKEKAQYCPGEVCEIKDRHEIQKTSRVHWLILSGFVVYMLLTIQLFNDFYSKPPYDLFGLSSHSQVEE